MGVAGGGGASGHCRDGGKGGGAGWEIWDLIMKLCASGMRAELSLPQYSECGSPHNF